MAGLCRLARGGMPVSLVVVLSAQALIRKVNPRAELAALTDERRVDSDIDRDATAERLIRAGYPRAAVV